MAKYLDKDGLTHYTEKMKAYVKDHGTTIGETTGTAYDGAKGKANADFIAAIQEKPDSKGVVTPTMTGAWTVYNAAGTAQSDMGSGSSLTLEKGYQVSFSGSWQWAHSDSYKDPTAASGSFGTTLPKTGVAVAYPTPDAKITTSTSIRQSVSAPMGQKWSMSNGYMQKISGGTSTASTGTYSVTFKNRRYWGLTTSGTITADVIKALPSTELNDSKGGTFTGISASTSQYWVLAYPAELGDLTSIVQNGATPLLDGGFVKTQVDVVNAAGKTVKYNVYKTQRMGALTDNSKLVIA